MQYEHDKTYQVRLSDIVVHDDNQVRADKELDQGHVDQIINAIQPTEDEHPAYPDDFDPVRLVLSSSGDLILVDGFHRVSAAKSLKMSLIPARFERLNLEDGASEDDEISLIAALANLSHKSKPLSGEDRREVIVRIGKHPRYKSAPSSEIARMVKVSPTWVSRVFRDEGIVRGAIQLHTKEGKPYEKNPARGNENGKRKAVAAAKQPAPLESHQNFTPVASFGLLKGESQGSGEEGSPWEQDEEGDSGLSQEELEAIAVSSAPVDSDAAIVVPEQSSIEQYTPEKLVEIVREFLGEIHLDPFSSDVANQIVKALKYHTKETNGLIQEWIAKNVYGNPPYSREHNKPCAEKIVEQFLIGNYEEGVFLVPMNYDATWCEHMVEYASAVCNLRGRVKFRLVSGELNGTPDFRVCFIYFGPRFREFVYHFQVKHDVGRCMIPCNDPSWSVSPA